MSVKQSEEQTLTAPLSPECADGFSYAVQATVVRRLPPEHTETCPQGGWEAAGRFGVETRPPGGQDSPEDMLTHTPTAAPPGLLAETHPAGLAVVSEAFPCPLHDDEAPESQGKASRQRARVVIAH